MIDIPTAMNEIDTWTILITRVQNILAEKRIMTLDKKKKSWFIDDFRIVFLILPKKYVLKYERK